MAAGKTIGFIILSTVVCMSPGPKLRNPTIQQVFRKTMGISFLGFGISLLRYQRP